MEPKTIICYHMGTVLTQQIEKGRVIQCLDCGMSWLAGTDASTTTIIMEAAEPDVEGSARLPSIVGRLVEVHAESVNGCLKREE